MPTNSEELNISFINKSELLPGIIMAETLNVVWEGGGLTGIVNMNDEEVGVTLLVVGLEECEIETDAMQVDNFVAQGAVRQEDRLQ